MLASPKRTEELVKVEKLWSQKHQNSLLAQETDEPGEGHSNPCHHSEKRIWQKTKNFPAVVIKRLVLKRCKVVHSGTKTEIKVRGEMSSSGHQARQKESTLRIPKTANRQAKARQGMKVHLRSASFTNEDNADRLRMFPSSNSGKMTVVEPKRQPRSDGIRGCNMIGQDKAGGLSQACSPTVAVFCAPFIKDGLQQFEEE